MKDVPVRATRPRNTRRGPALQAAFDADGYPTKPAEGFARSCGVAVAELEQMETDKGTWLVFNSTTTGKAATEITSRDA